MPQVKGSPTKGSIKDHQLVINKIRIKIRPSTLGSHIVGQEDLVASQEWAALNKIVALQGSVILD